jgi:hypothetical protein
MAEATLHNTGLRQAQLIEVLADDLITEQLEKTTREVSGAVDDTAETIFRKL